MQLEEFPAFNSNNSRDMVNGESEYPIGSCHTQTKLDFSANSPEIQEQNKKKGDRNEFLTAAE